VRQEITSLSVSFAANENKYLTNLLINQTRMVLNWGWRDREEVVVPDFILNLNQSEL